LLISKYGFNHVLQPGMIVPDPSRMAAQIVSGIGFIGAGLIFVRRDSVRPDHRRLHLDHRRRRRCRTAVPRRGDRGGRPRSRRNRLARACPPPAQGSSHGLRRADPPRRWPRLPRRLLQAATAPGIHHRRALGLNGRIGLGPDGQEGQDTLNTSALVDPAARARHVPVSELALSEVDGVASVLVGNDEAADD
jgi:hypothetical protein